MTGGDTNQVITTMIKTFSRNSSPLFRRCVRIAALRWIEDKDNADACLKLVVMSTKVSLDFVELKLGNDVSSRRAFAL